jgi:hypothetical protein
MVDGCTKAYYRMVSLMAYINSDQHRVGRHAGSKFQVVQISSELAVDLLEDVGCY